jgi:hypothetical protein
MGWGVRNVQVACGLLMMGWMVSTEQLGCFSISPLTDRDCITILAQLYTVVYCCILLIFDRPFLISKGKGRAPRIVVSSESDGWCLVLKNARFGFVEG